MLFQKSAYRSPKYWPAGGTEVPPGLTSAAGSFVDEHFRWLEFSNFYQAATFREIGPVEDLATIKTKEADEIRRLTDRLNNALKEFQAHADLMSELIVAKTADNFLTYVSDLLSLIYKVRPEMLRSSDLERVDFILRHDTMDELRNSLAERKVERLSYLGLSDLDSYMNTQMGFSLFEDEGEKEHAGLIIEYRNLLAHNRGVVSAISVRRFPQLRDMLGKRVKASSDELDELHRFLAHAVFEIDVRAAAKFGLPVKAVPSPPAELLNG